MRLINRLIRMGELVQGRDRQNRAFLHGMYLAKCTNWISQKCFRFRPVILLSAPWDRSGAGGIRHNADMFRRVIPL